MNKYESLEAKACKDGIDIIVYDFHSKRIKGLYFNNIIGINKHIKTMTEKACVLAEELGHFETSVGNILDQSSTNNRKQEHKARAWAYKEMIAPSDLLSAFRSGCRNKYEIAEHVGVTEEFLEEALSYFATQYPYGYKNKIEHYMIQFIPSLDIITLFD